MLAATLAAPVSVLFSLFGVGGSSVSPSTPALFWFWFWLLASCPGIGVRIDVGAGGDLWNFIYALGQLERAQEFFIQSVVLFGVERNDRVEPFLCHKRADGSAQVAKSHLV